jgi:hypothetical protein
MTNILKPTGSGWAYEATWPYTTASNIKTTNPEIFSLDVDSIETLEDVIAVCKYILNSRIKISATETEVEAMPEKLKSKMVVTKSSVKTMDVMEVARLKAKGYMFEH